jgi:uncharacterized protein YuzE
MERDLSQEGKEIEGNIIIDIKEMGLVIPIRLEWFRF